MINFNNQLACNVGDAIEELYAVTYHTQNAQEGHELRFKLDLWRLSFR